MSERINKTFSDKKKKLVTVTAVRPPARFGAIKIVKDTVKYFREKNSISIGANLYANRINRSKSLNFTSNTILNSKTKFDFISGITLFVNWVKKQEVMEDKYEISLKELQSKGFIK